MAAINRYPLYLGNEDWEINVIGQSGASGGWKSMTLDPSSLSASWDGDYGVFATEPFYVRAYWAELHVGESYVDGLDIDFIISDNVGLPLGNNSEWCALYVFEPGYSSTADYYKKVPLSVTRTSNTSYRIKCSSAFDDTISVQTIMIRFTPENYDGSSSQIIGPLVQAGSMINVSIPSSSQNSVIWQVSGATGSGNRDQQITNGLLEGISGSINQTNEALGELIHGNSSTDSVNSAIDSAGADLGFAIGEYDNLESQYQEDMTINLQAIQKDVSEFSLTNNLVVASQWFSTQLAYIFNNLGDFKMFVLVPAILAIALFFIGRGSVMFSPPEDVAMENRYQDDMKYEYYKIFRHHK